jgi:hypothetical protein
MIELTVEFLTESLLLVLADSDGRRAASKTNKNNTMRRKVSIIERVFKRRIAPIEKMLGP